MKKLIYLLLLVMTFNLVYAENIYKQIDDFDSGWSEWIKSGNAINVTESYIYRKEGSFSGGFWSKGSAIGDYTYSQFIKNYNPINIADFENISFWIYVPDLSILGSDRWDMRIKIYSSTADYNEYFFRDKLTKNGWNYVTIPIGYRDKTGGAGADLSNIIQVRFVFYDENYDKEYVLYIDDLKVEKIKEEPLPYDKDFNKNILMIVFLVGILFIFLISLRFVGIISLTILSVISLLLAVKLSEYSQPLSWIGILMSMIIMLRYFLNR